MDEAIGPYTANLDVHLRRLCPGHPRTLRNRSRLANTLDPAGRYQEEAVQFGDVLEEPRRVLVHRHPDTLRGRGSLAHTFVCLGRSGEPEELYRQTLLEREEALGPHHS